MTYGTDSWDDEPVPAPPGTFDELTPVELAALDVVMAVQGWRRVTDPENDQEFQT